MDRRDECVRAFRRQNKKSAEHNNNNNNKKNKKHNNDNNNIIKPVFDVCREDVLSQTSDYTGEKSHEF